VARWQVQEAKMRLSQVIEEAQSKGPQMITRHGVDRAVVLSIDDFRTLSAHKPGPEASTCSEGPRWTISRLEPDRDPGREIAL
jgi:antitoxin Phd